MSRFRFISLLAISILITGCASLVNQDLVNVPVYTNPPGAKLFVAGRAYQSPDIVKVPRGQGDFELIIEKPGYQRAKVVLKESFDAWLWYNVFNLGLGLRKDFMSKRAYDLDPEIVNITLVAE